MLIVEFKDRFRMKVDRVSERFNGGDEQLSVLQIEINSPELVKEIKPVDLAGNELKPGNFDVIRVYKNIDDTEPLETYTVYKYLSYFSKDIEKNNILMCLSTVPVNIT